MADPIPHPVEKWLWETADFERMGWHDVYVHGLAYDGEAGRFFLDLDYILEWVHPVESTDRHYSFWMSPATMVFEDVSELHVDLQPLAAFEIESLKRTDQQVEEGPGGRAGSERWRWTMAFFNGEISLRSSGYRLHLRAAPALSKTQYFPLDERGGVSFAEVARDGA